MLIVINRSSFDTNSIISYDKSSLIPSIYFFIWLQNFKPHDICSGETHHVLRGDIDGTKADADEARTIREATDKTFMVG